MPESVSESEFDLLTYAAISADIAEGDQPLGAILLARGLTEAKWTEGAIGWSRRMAEDVVVDASGSVSAAAASAFSDAFARAQDEKRPLVPLSVTEWASLEGEIEAEGVGQVLRRRGLRMADYARLIRHWAKSLGSSPALARTYAAARAR